MARRRVSPRRARRMMEKMGMKMNVISAREVIIRKETTELVIEDPEVTVMEMQGKRFYQVVGASSFERPIKSGEETGEEKTPEIPEEDVQLVAAQANVGLEAARKALEETDGDLAQAILNLSLMKG